MNPDKKENFYENMRADANDNVVRAGQRLDYIIFIITTGAFIVSVDILFNIQLETIDFIVLLLLSWLCLLFSIVLHSKEYRDSANYNKRVIKKLDDWYDKNYEGKFILPKDNKNEKNYKPRDLWDVPAFSFGLLGLLLLVLFVSINILNKPNVNYIMTNKKSDDIQKVDPKSDNEKSADNVLRETNNEESSSNNQDSGENDRSGKDK